jgi:methionine synthase II (cobalamin-independent)
MAGRNASTPCATAAAASRSISALASAAPVYRRFLAAIADVLHEEYKTITDAGLLLQVDDPDLPDGRQMFPDMTVPEYRRYAALRVEALNHVLRGIPAGQVRLHVCWGSHHGPHRDDIPLRDIVDLVLSGPRGLLLDRGGQPAARARVGRLAGREAP